MFSEFDFIRRHFVRPSPGTRLGVGDDCALMQPTPGQELAVSTDLLVAGRHFFEDVDPGRLGRKSAAVNLSDMAAMGALPRWVTLGLTLARPDEVWTGAFADGFYHELQAHGVDWVGGDTTAGPTTVVAVTILGELPPGQALRRSGAVVGDDVWVSGTPGDAALGLRMLQTSIVLADQDRRYCLDRLETPTPRVSLGLALRGLAHAAIDISDGLLADLGHILDASGVGACVEFDRIPRSPALDRQQHLADWQMLALAGGDDYELCFTAAAQDAPAIQQAAARAQVQVSRIGRITAATQERCVLDVRGQPLQVSWHGFDHFRTT